MKNITRSLIKRPVTISIIVVLLLVFGVMATLKMPVSLISDVNMPMVGVITTYPGADAESVQNDITLPLTSAAKTVSGLDSVKSYSLDDASILILTFDYGVDLDKKIAGIEDAIATVTLPAEAKTPSIETVNLNGEATTTLSLHSATATTEELRAEAEKVKDLAYSIDGVGEVSFFGSPSSRIRITPHAGFDAATLIAAQALANSAYDIPLGTMLVDGTTVSVRNASEATSLAELASLPVKLTLPSTLITSLARLKSALADTRSEISRLEGLSASEATTERTRANVMAMLSALKTLESSSSASELSTYYATVLSPVVNEASFVSLSSTELASLSASSGISLPLLAFFQTIEAHGGAADATMTNLIAFQEAYPAGGGTLTDEALSLLVSSGESGRYAGFGLMTKDEAIALYAALSRIDLASYEKILAERTAGGATTDEEYARYLAPSFPSLSASLVGCLRNEECTDEELATSLSALDLGFTVTGAVVNFMNVTDLSRIDVTEDEASVIIALSTVASVTLEENYTSIATYVDHDGVVTPAITVYVYATSDANTTAIDASLRNKVKEAGLTVDVSYTDDKAEYVSDSITNILSTIAVGCALAIIVIILFLKRLRSSLIIAITMPLSVLVALLCLYGMGITLNLVSLGGLCVGIGMLVDNSIIEIEAIAKHESAGESLQDACVNGTSEVFSSLLASTLTNICVFLPILFLEGITKEIFYDLVWSIVFSMVMSFIAAVTVIPVLYHLAFRSREGKEKSVREVKGEESLKRTEARFTKSLRKVLRHKGAFAIGSLVLFLASLALVFVIPTEFLPSLDQGNVEVDLSFANSVSLADCTAATNSLSAAIAMRDDVAEQSATIGSQGLLALSTSGKIRIALESGSDTDKAVDEIRTLAQSMALSGAEVTVTNIDGVVESLTGGYATNGYTIKSASIETLKSAAHDFEEALVKEEGITNASDDLSATVTQYAVKFDMTRMLEKGLDYQSAVYLLRFGLSGYTAATLAIDGADTDVVVSFASDRITSRADLLSLELGYASGSVVHLADVATVSIAEKPSVILMSDGLYATQVEVESTGLTTGQVTKVMNRVALDVLAGRDVTYESAGISSYLDEAFSGLLIAAIIAFFLLYFVMASQFESLLKPLIIILAIPLSLSGGFIALWITGVSLNVVSFIGFITLMGVIVNNAIVVIDRINYLERKGFASLDAVLQGSSDRLRAVLMTTLTTVLALVPMSLGIGTGAGLMQPLGIVVLGGLLLGASLDLYLIPAFYCLVKHVKTRTVRIS